MNTIEQQRKLQEKEIDECLNLHNCASACDCTGTVAMNPETDEGISSYDEIYHFRPIVPDKMKNL